MITIIVLMRRMGGEEEAAGGVVEATAKPSVPVRFIAIFAYPCRI